MISCEKIYCHLANGEKPVTADIYLTDICNNNCPYCVYTAHTRRNGKSMRFEDFVKYADRLRSFGVQGIILTGGGEPTLNPDFERITAWLEENGIPYGINTNFNVYKEFNPKFLKVSLDGYDRESYKARRGVDAYEKTIENIKRFAARRGKTRLGIQTLVSCVEDVSRFYNAHRNLDVDYMSFRPMESRHGEYYNNRGDEADRIVWKIESLKDSRVVLNYKWDRIFDEVDGCPGHPYEICVNQNGQVQYCCHKPNHIVGHIMDEDILDKYNAAEFCADDCDVPCRMSGVNYALKKLDAMTDKEFL